MLEFNKQSQPFTVRGDWWIPGSDIRQVGDLEYSVSGLDLKIRGALHNCVGAGFLNVQPSDLSPPVIHGRTKDGEDVTLYHNWYRTWQPAGPRASEISDSSLVCRVLLTGGHYAGIDDQQFDSIVFHLEHSEQWFGHNAFDVKDSDNPAEVAYVLYAKQPSHLSVTTNLGLVATQSFNSQSGGHYHPMTLEHIWHFELRPDQPKPLQWLLSAIRRFERLFTVMLGIPIHTDSVIASPVWATDHRPEFHLGTYIFGAHKRAANKDFKFKPLVRYGDIKDQFDHVIKSWLADGESIDHAANLFFGSIYQPSEFIEERFLPTIQTLEVMSREMFDDCYTSKDEFDRARAAIEAAINGFSEGLVGSMLRSIGHANGLSLRDRLEKLINRLEEPTQQMLCSNVKEFVGGLVRTRNFHTHYSPSRDKILRGEAMHWAITKMRSLITVILLKRAGLSEELIRKQFDSHYEIRNGRKVWSEITETGERRETNQ